MIGHNPPFQDFLRHWREERIDSLRCGTMPGDRETLIQRRTGELLELALRHGYQVELADRVEPYLTATAYVTSLFQASEDRLKLTRENVVVKTDHAANVKTANDS